MSTEEVGQVNSDGELVTDVLCDIHITVRVKETGGLAPDVSIVPVNEEMSHIVASLVPKLLVKLGDEMQGQMSGALADYMKRGSGGGDDDNE